MAANLYAAATNAVFALVVRTVEDQKTIDDQLSPTPTAGSPGGGPADAWTYAREVSDYFSAAATGAKSINIMYADGASTGFATGTITFTTNPANNDTITIAGVLITLVTGTPSGSQVKIGASLVATIANIVTFINAGGSANGLQATVTATATSGTVITINSFFPGLLGNLITMAKVSTAISAITATLAGGVMLSASSTAVSVGI
jgi:hypothetical protein